MILLPFYYQIFITSPIHFSIKGWEDVLFQLGSEGVKRPEISTVFSKLLFLFHMSHVMCCISLWNYEVLKLWGAGCVGNSLLGETSIPLDGLPLDEEMLQTVTIGKVRIK